MNNPVQTEQPKAGEYEVIDGAMVERCRSCGAAITWVTTPKGKAMPVNVGNLRIINGKGYGLSHFATCPHGRQWRKQ